MSNINNIKINSLQSQDLTPNKGDQSRAITYGVANSFSPVTQNQGTVYQGTINQGTLNQGTLNHGTLNQGSFKQLSRGNLNQGALNQSSNTNLNSQMTINNAGMARKVELK